MGTYGGALEARQIEASQDRLWCEAVGELELDEKVLVIRRIHVKMMLKTEEQNQETCLRVHEVFADRCPVYKTLKPAIAMTTEVVFV